MVSEGMILALKREVQFFLVAFLKKISEFPQGGKDGWMVGVGGRYPGLFGGMLCYFASTNINDMYYTLDK